MAERHDFSGWVTQYNIKCTDGRTIRNNAFAHMDGESVPLVVNHVHDDPEKWIGHVDLEHVPGKGLYGRASLNNGPAASAAREAVAHGDVNSFSIYANHLQHRGADVLHGDVKEVSLVLCGANAGAKIDVPVLTHSGIETFVSSTSDEYDFDDFEAAKITIPSGGFEMEDDLAHDDLDYYEDEDGYEDMAPTYGDAFDAMSEEDQDVVRWFFEQGLEAGLAHSDDDLFDEDGEIDIEAVEDSLSPVQQAYVDASIDAALDETIDDVIDAVVDEVYDGLADNEAAHSDLYHSELYHYDTDKGEVSMKSNIFEASINGGPVTQVTLTHADFAEIIEAAQTNRQSLAQTFKSYVADTVLAHSDDQPYGIENIEILFPDAKLYQNEPGFIKRKTEWVDKILGGTSHRPFSRIKTRYADITKDEARAKGYIKGNRKVEEVFELLQRSTGPCTIYKKQKIDRDDKLDITDFSVVNFIKKEMRLMLDEEIARAILIGDGRSSISKDKIKEDCIRPIVNEDDLFCIKAAYTYKTDEDPDMDEASKARSFIKTVIKSRKQYRGSGSPALITTEDMITACLLLEDAVGRPLYETEEKLRTKLRVSEIITVPVMEGFVRTDKNAKKWDVDGIVVNLTDYVVGADKGGEINTFEDFDIDYNQEKFLMETRMSGSLVEPYSAIVLEREHVEA